MVEKPTHELLADRAIGLLNNHLDNWPTCYPTLEDYWHDFYPSLPWDGTLKDSVQYLLTHPLLDEVEAKTKTKFGSSIREELVRGLKEITSDK